MTATPWSLIVTFTYTNSETGYPIVPLVRRLAEYLFILVQDEIAPAQRMLGAVQHRLEPIRSLTVDSPHDVRMLYTAYR